MTVPQVKLSDVGKKALQDRQFFEKLVRTRDRDIGESQAVLAQYDMSLTKEDAKTLARALREPAPITFDLTKFLGTIHQHGVAFDGIDWTDFCTDWFIKRP
jgi:hypothetical protein